MPTIEEFRKNINEIKIIRNLFCNFKINKDNNLVLKQYYLMLNSNPLIKSFFENVYIDKKFLKSSLNHTSVNDTIVKNLGYTFFDFKNSNEMIKLSDDELKMQAKSKNHNIIRNNLKKIIYFFDNTKIETIPFKP